jgi:hypothetical protein
MNGLGRSLLTRIPREEHFTSRLRSPAVSTRVGVWLGICFLVAFITGLVSHVAQSPTPWFPFPTRPSWGYRVTQGLHVVSGTAAIPLLLVKLWSVFPKLFARLPRGRREQALVALERGSIAVLVGASIFQIASGLANSAQWYPWHFSFRATHFALGWVAIGALLVHVAVKLPVIRQALTHSVDDSGLDRANATASGSLTRRGLLRSTWVAAGAAVVLSAGSTVPLLRRVSVFGVRSGEGPAGIPINKSAVAAGVVATALSPAYRLLVSFDGRTVELTRKDLEALPQTSADLPIACVEGWSASGTWTGVRVSELLALVDAGDHDVQVVSLQQDGAFRETTLPSHFARDPLTLLALRLNGEALAIDHGYPARLIAPNRPGVLQTKWVARLEVTS